MKLRTLVVLGAFAVVAAVAMPLAQRQASERERTEPVRPAVSAAAEACLNRGIAYFQSIGSYPTLTAAPHAGRNAVDVARERCKGSVQAFP